MNTYHTKLPESAKLDIRALSRLFKSTSTSYKFLFFLAMLNKLQATPQDTEQPVVMSLQDLAVEMALLSWYPIKFYKLSFGWQDQMATVINRLDFDPSLKAATSAQGQRQLRESIRQQAKSIGLYTLLRFVPYRLQSVFFVEELKGLPEKQKNNRISDLATQYGSDKAPLYQFVNHQQAPSIEMHPRWVKYLLQDSNISIVKEWALWEWVNYLQRRNPNTPAIVNKVLPPIKRSALNKQTHFWKQVLQQDTTLRCIYSGEKLANQAFSLDHFLPWTFVCHDQIWNLCPVTPSSNSSKGNRLPANEYMDAFIQQQTQALGIGSKVLSTKEWLQVVEPYAIDLRLDPELLLDESAVYEAYRGVLTPMLALAEQTGFEAGWSYDG